MSKIILGNVDPFPAEPDAKDESVRISIMMEGDLLDALKSAALKAGLPYQSFMKLLLRRALEQGSDGSIEERVARLESALLQSAFTKPKAGTAAGNTRKHARERAYSATQDPSARRREAGRTISRTKTSSAKPKKRA